MKIIQTNKAYYPKIGGIETAVKTLSEGFVNEYNVEVEVLVCNHKINYKKDSIKINGVGVTYLPTYGFALSLPLSPSYPWELLKMEGDILHIHQPFPLADLTFEIFPRLKKKFSKIITAWHCDITRQKWLLPVYGKFIHRFLKTVDKIIVSNPYIIESSEFLRHYKNKCEVIPIGVDLDWVFESEPEKSLSAKESKSDKNYLILFVGRLVVYKGIEYLIESMQYIENASLIIVGSGPLEKPLKNLISKLNLETKIKIIPEVEEDTLHDYYKNCDVFVLPSINKTEAYGIVQIEAMACGVPLVSTELGTGTTFINQNGINGIVVPPSNAKELAEAVNRILGDHQLSQILGINGKKRALQEFTSNKMIQTTYQLYQQLLSS